MHLPSLGRVGWETSVGLFGRRNMFSLFKDVWDVNRLYVSNCVCWWTVHQVKEEQAVRAMSSAWLRDAVGFLLVPPERKCVRLLEMSGPTWQLTGQDALASMFDEPCSVFDVCSLWW